ncbi:hypothetical protein CCUS01_00780 [Colletotrichum cuscutae]|uniref:Uncharacterized protein n=1 Tax=Colletotrichum cuscutae TaxID=1209917 RepID=A0AAI9V4T8_9PEZI|nr:hypothetical protein CCUS01_00780 [Colletotrichum cuscutae]
MISLYRLHAWPLPIRTCMISTTDPVHESRVQTGSGPASRTPQLRPITLRPQSFINRAAEKREREKTLHEAAAALPPRALEMHISPPVYGGPPLSTLSLLRLLLLLLLSNIVLGSTTTTPTPTTTSTQNQRNEPAAPPNRAYKAPHLTITPAPDPVFASHRLLRARQGDPRSSDGRTNFIAWYSQSGAWVSATCPADNYFAADSSTDARRIIFCIAMSELYVLPMTWYRVTHPHGFPRSSSPRSLRRNSNGDPKHNGDGDSPGRREPHEWASQQPLPFAACHDSSGGGCDDLVLGSCCTMRKPS